MAEPVTVAIPVRNGGPLLGEVLGAVRSQRFDRPVDVLVADSGSTDGSRELAREHGAAIIDLAPESFSHGGTRRLLSGEAQGSHVAFLTQDAVPADDRWLASLIDGFSLAPDVALVFGPYRPRAGASPMVRRELEEWFRTLSPDGTQRVERGAPANGDPLSRFYFTDANGCVLRSALERVPFRDVPYAEDQLLARDMLAAGYAKVYRPDAPVTHSHDYGPIELFRRSFDEWRGLREVHGERAAAGPLTTALGVQRDVRDDLRAARREDSAGRLPQLALSSVVHHSARAAGAMLGARADRLPPRARSLCSLERREGFRPC